MHHPQHSQICTRARGQGGSETGGSEWGGQPGSQAGEHSCIGQRFGAKPQRECTEFPVDWVRSCPRAGVNCPGRGGYEKGTEGSIRKTLRCKESGRLKVRLKNVTVRRKRVIQGSIGKATTIMMPEGFARTWFLTHKTRFLLLCTVTFF